jgi:hypothetical protein
LYGRDFRGGRPKQWQANQISANRLVAVFSRVKREGIEFSTRLSWPSRPVIPVQTPILNRLTDVG